MSDGGASSADARIEGTDATGGGDGGAGSDLGGPSADPAQNVAVDCAVATCRYVTPSGAGAQNGSDWSNALPGLPSPLVRGTTYLLAAGTYPALTIGTALSGSEVITIKKASDLDHGSDVGWEPIYGNAAPATFSGTIRVNVGYVTLDGTFPYGIRRVVADSPGSAGIYIGATDPAPRSKITIRYVDIGSVHGDVPHNFAGDVRAIEIFPYVGNNTFARITDLLVERSNLHAVSTIVQIDQNGSTERNNLTFQYNKLHDNLEAAGYNPATMAHQNVLYMTNTKGVTFRLNEIYRTTAVGFYPSQNSGYFEIYGNVWHDVSGAAIWVVGNGAAQPGINIHNNTFADVGIVYIESPVSGSGGAASNNLIYDSPQPGWGNTFTKSNNWVGSGVSPFMSASDFHLKASSAAAPISLAGAALPSPMGQTIERDPDGKTRGGDGTWDVGAYEFE